MAAIHNFFLIFILISSIKLIITQNDLCKIFIDRLTSKKTMYCGLEHNLTQIPSEIDPSIETFVLTGSEFQYYDTIERMGNMFKNLPNLIELKIQYTKIRFLPKNAFEKSNKLANLDLSNNYIEDFFKETWTNLTNLRVLNLSNNKFASQILSSYTFASLNQLEILDLSNNKLHEIGDKVLSNLKNLIELKLNGNQLSSLRHYAMSNSLKNLHFLNVSNCVLKDLESEFLDKIPNLQVLDASHNHLVKIGEEHFKNLTNITWINLSFNQLKELNENVFNSLTLNYLDLSNNKLENISRSAFKDLGCQNLILSSNFHVNKTQLRLSLNTLSNLESLDLSSINLNDNDLSIDPELNELPLQEQAYNLKKLNLSNNFLTFIPRMPEFRKIRELDFSFNKIKSLNEVETNIPDVFNKLQTKQIYVYLQENPFSCYKCDLDPLFTFDAVNYKCSKDDYYCLKCYEPYNLRGFSVQKLNETYMISCGLPMRFAKLLNSKKSDSSYTLITIIVIVVVSLFVSLCVVYYKKILSAVYYTGNKRTYYTREPKHVKLIHNQRDNKVSKKGSELENGELSSKFDNPNYQIVNDNKKLEDKINKTELPEELNNKNFIDIDLKEQIDSNKRVSVSSLVNTFNHLISTDSFKLNNKNDQKVSVDKLDNCQNGQTVVLEHLSSESLNDEKKDDLKYPQDAYVAKFHDPYLV